MVVIKRTDRDRRPAIQPLLRNGEVPATVGQLGGDGIDNAVEGTAGQKPTGWIRTPLKLVTG